MVASHRGPHAIKGDNGRTTLHATTVRISGAGLLVMGPSGAGKSGLAAQLMAFGADLVCDDLTVVTRRDGDLFGSAASAAPGRIELRGMGIVEVPIAGEVRIRAAIWLGPSLSRLPESEELNILDCHVPLVRHPFTHDAAAKTRLWLLARDCPITLSRDVEDPAYSIPKGVVCEPGPSEAR